MPETEEGKDREQAELEAETAREVRERVMSDPHRPHYHFCNPEGIAMPFDPNGAIYWNGRYHLFYIFQDEQLGHSADHWGHVSSTDLVHWRHHPTHLLDGMYSGNCFVNADGVPTICYHQKGAGNAMAVALDDDLNDWRKLGTITPSTTEADPHHDRYRSWDPYGWLEGDTYYAIFGGKQPGIAKAESLEGEWRYAGDLFAHGLPGVSLNEDVSCADLFRLGNKDVLLCISHRLGCRYYIGEWREEQFHPESHAQMSWVDHTFFAPESLLAPDGRRIMWSWLMDEPGFKTCAEYGWSGTMSLPRVLSMGEDGVLAIEVAQEIESLRGAATSVEPTRLDPHQSLIVPNIAGNSLELLLELGSESSAGVEVCRSPGGEEATVVRYDPARAALEVDTRNSGPDAGALESAPLTLRAGEPLRLRVFVDKSVIEVFANGRQAVTRRMYPARVDSLGVRLQAGPAPLEVHRLDAWHLTPANPF